MVRRRTWGIICYICSNRNFRCSMKMSWFRPWHFVLLLVILMPRASHAQNWKPDEADIDEQLLYNYGDQMDTITLNRNNARSLAVSGDTVHVVFSVSRTGVIWYNHTLSYFPSSTGYIWWGNYT